MSKVRCSKCGGEHDLSQVEPTFNRPDAFFRVPVGERERRVSHSDDGCLIASPDGKDLACFFRVVLPVPVKGEARPIGWWLWVEGGGLRGVRRAWPERRAGG